MITTDLCPDVVTYTALIDGFCKEIRVDDAVCIYDTMVKEGRMPNAVAYNLIVHGLCNAESVDVARIVVEKIMKECLPLDVTTYNTLLNGYCRNRSSDAFALCHEMRRHGVKENEAAYNILINLMCKVECYSASQGTRRCSREGFCQIILCIILVNAYS